MLKNNLSFRQQPSSKYLVDKIKKVRQISSTERNQTRIRSLLKLLGSNVNNAELQPSQERVFSKGNDKPMGKLKQEQPFNFKSAQSETISYPAYRRKYCRQQASSLQRKSQNKIRGRQRQKMWQSKIRQNQVAIKFPQINLVQSTLQIQERSLKPNHQTYQKKYMNAKKAAKYSIKSISNRLISEQKCKYAIDCFIGKSISAWTSKNWA